MTRTTPLFLTLLVGSAIALYAAAQTEHPRHDEHPHQHAAHEHAMITDAIAVLLPTEGSETRGVVRFHEDADGRVTVNAVVLGLKPNAMHAIHIHEFGDISDPAGKAAGDHYNPEGHKHGLPSESADQRHAGDFGNLQADDEGKATLEATFDNITINGQANPILGRGLIVHALPDDGGQPTGNAGARIAQGVIGVAKAVAE